jgi:hypothetical protein
VAGPDNRRIECGAGADVVVGRPFGAQIRRKDLILALRRVGVGAC